MECGQEGRTREVPNNIHPEWNETFNLVVIDHLQHLCINVMHNDPKGPKKCC